MSAIAARRPAHVPSRRDRAAAIAAAAWRGGLLAAVVAAVAWLAVTVIAGTVFVILIVATIAAAGVTALAGRDLPIAVWGGLGVGWAIVLLERWAVHGHAGVWVAAAAWLGVFAASRRAGISKWALPLLAYPLISVGIVLGAHASLLSPWGISWLWVAAILGPVFGAKVLLRG
jgi:hypothetical protein